MVLYNECMNKKYKIITYGCQMNVHDSEKIAGILESMGFTSTKDNNLSDIIVFNTCCIRDTAEKKALGNIGAIKHFKETNKNLIIAVVGCMSQQQEIAELLKERYNFIDIILGTNNIESLKYAILKKLNENKRTNDICNNQKPLINEDIPIFRTSGTNAWVDIMYGCNNYCTYCIVPIVRGRERSRNIENIINEIEEQVKLGYKEITLLGQNVNSYGSDFPDKNINFPYLIDKIACLEGDFRIRFMTSHPKDFNSDVIDAIAKHDKICNYIHLPVQSGSNSVLKRMNRKYTKEHYLALINMIYEKLPNVGISSDIMVGFPGETEEEFQDTLDLVRQAKFSTAFTFIYSRRKGTMADKMPEQIPYEIKKNRIGELIKLQKNITKEHSKKFIGKTVRVLIEDINPKHKNTVCGREDSGRLVNILGDEKLIGTFKMVEIIEAKSASLWGKIKDE